jgi:phage terminase large subunit-like protein
VLIEGTVTDQSPGAKDTPAIADASMTQWMEYLYMQKPMPTNAVGVEVVVSVVDPNGNCYEVGRTTTDTSGMFKMTFTPEVPGEYTVVATFEGSESYWCSYAETAIGVSEAPAATPEPTPVPQAPVEMYFAVSTIAIIVAIAIVGLMILRKKP